MRSTAAAAASFHSHQLRSRSAPELPLAEPNLSWSKGRSDNRPAGRPWGEPRGWKIFLGPSSQLGNLEQHDSLRGCHQGRRVQTQKCHKPKIVQASTQKETAIRRGKKLRLIVMFPGHMTFISPLLKACQPSEVSDPISSAGIDLQQSPPVIENP